jgi:hypothetical protein
MRKRLFQVLFFGLLGFLLILTPALFFLHKNVPRLSQPSSMTAASIATSTTLAPPPEPVGPAGGTHPEIRRVTLEQAKSAFDTRSAVFVDVRSAAFYADSHIPGAINIPLADLAAHLNELDPERWIITYCT